VAEKSGRNFVGAKDLASTYVLRPRSGNLVVSFNFGGSEFYRNDRDNRYTAGEMSEE
jgi:hypothetical protein